MRAKNSWQRRTGIINIFVLVIVVILFFGTLYFLINHRIRIGAPVQKNTLPPKAASPATDSLSRLKEPEKEEPQTTTYEEKTAPNQQASKYKETQYHRQEISFLKFVSSENCLYSLSDSEISELKSLNINGIRICPLYSIREDGRIQEDVPDFIIKSLINKAHQAGLAVFLEPNFAGPPASTEFGGFPHITNPVFIEKIYELSLYWAKIAQEEQVEFYSPLNEPNAVFDDLKLVDQWIKKSQDIKPFFSGNLVLKLADVGPQKIDDISRYDYLAFDIMWSDARYQELRDYLQIAVKKGNNLKKQYNLKGFFFGELGAERAEVDKNTQAEIFRIIFEETWGKTDGYCFLGWSNLEYRFKDNMEAKEIIKDWFLNEK